MPVVIRTDLRRVRRTHRIRNIGPKYGPATGQFCDDAVIRQRYGLVLMWSRGDNNVLAATASRSARRDDIMLP